jgi:hypothetical protein
VKDLSARMRTPFAIRLSLIVLAALAIRVAFVLVARRDAAVWGDAFWYHEGANLLADGKGVIDPFRYEFARITQPSAAHPPLYTFYLSFWSVLGLSGPLAHRLVTCLLGAATVALSGLLGRRLGGDRVGLVAAALAAVYPHLWLNDALLLSETVTAFAVVLLMLTVERFRAAPSGWRAAEMGAATALATLGRAELALLFPLIVIPLVVVVRATPRQKLERLVACGAVAFVLLGPWMIWNVVRFHQPELVSSGFGPAINAGACDRSFSGPSLGYWGNCGIPQAPLPTPDTETIARWQADPKGTQDEVHAFFSEHYSRDVDERGRLRDESDFDHDSRQAAFDYFREHTRELPKVVAARVGRIWNVYRPFQGIELNATIDDRGMFGARIGFATYWIYMAGAIVGLVVLHRRRHPIWPYVMLAVEVTLIVMLTYGIQRFRIPVDAVAPTLAAVAAVALWDRWRGTSEPAVLASPDDRNGRRASPKPEVDVQTSLGS